MSLTTSFQLSQDSVFRPKVLMAVVTAAVAVQAESGSTPNDASRKSYATKVLNSPLSYLDAWAFSVSSNVAINSGSADGDISFTVNSLWDAMAGTGA